MSQKESKQGKKQKDSKKKQDDASPGKLGRKEYEKELERLHVELVKLQQWVVHKGLKSLHSL